jgi:plastocyanin
MFEPSNQAPEEMLQEQSPEAAKETQKLIDEVSGGDLDPETNSNIVSLSLPSEGADLEEGATSSIRVVKAIIVADGNSLINTETGEVIQADGKLADNTASAGSPEAPRQSFPLASVDELPESTIKLKGSYNSFSPNTFTVNSGQAVSLAVTNVNSVENDVTFSVIFRFDEPSLSGVVLGVSKGGSKTITFNAPQEAGEYVFYNSQFNHRDLGAVGTMIVK